MTLFDLSVMFFFFMMIVKLMVDTYDFWYGERETAENVISAAMAPKHLPKPVRPSPEHINISKSEVKRNVRPIPATRVAKTVVRPIKKQPAVARKVA